MVHIEHRGRNPLAIASLTIDFTGEQKLSFARESGERMNILVRLNETLLKDEVMAANSNLSLPFQLALPEPAARHAELVKQSVRLANILTPPCSFNGLSTHGATYDGSTTYTLKAELKEQSTPSFFSSAPQSKIRTTKVSPFLVHDPRQLPFLLQPDGKRWRSAPGDSPLEYEIEITSTTLGPSDQFSFLYRLAVARDAAAKGIRVKKVVLMLREHKTLGTTISHLVPPAYKCIRGSIEIKRWEFEEADYHYRRNASARDLLESSEDDGYQDFGFEIEGDGIPSAAEEESVNGDNDVDDEEEEGFGTEDGSGPGSLDFNSNRDLSPQVPPLTKGHSQKIKVQSRQTRRRKANHSRGRHPHRNGFDAGVVEMSELRPRRKMVEGMSTYNPSHALSTNAQSYDAPGVQPQHQRRANTFADGWSGGPGGDGLYVENEVQITMPTLAAFVPDSFKPSDNNLIYPNPHNHMYTSVPYIEVKHTLQVRVELTGVEKPIVHECWVTVTSVGKKECNSILDNRIELMPTLDYDKVFGTDTWVPAYTRVDPFLGDFAPLPPSPVVEDEGDEVDAFFGSLKHLVKKLPQSTSRNHHQQQHHHTEATIPHFQFPAPASSSSSSSISPYRPITPSPARQGTSPTRFADNFFQKRPSISSILSFTQKQHLSGIAPSSPSVSDYSDIESDKEEPIHHHQHLSPPPASSSKTRRKMSIQTNNLNLIDSAPPLPSAHTLLSRDAEVAMQSPTNQRLFQELATDRGKNKSARAIYPQTRLDVSPSSGGGLDDEDVIGGEEEEDGALLDDTREIGKGKTVLREFVKHPLLGEEEVEARRRRVVEKKMERRSKGLVSADVLFLDSDSAGLPEPQLPPVPPPVLEGEEPPLYRESEFESLSNKN
ncbi:UNVERIFIED_CONTAM: hypothetical protein HDU68_001694 [Siphonaria sp. JEL0065]|nr:hypothetical protein HDU68_001694 [Siphonaria sp. JEL0065]